MLDFTGRHFTKLLILQALRWYLSYPLRYRHVEELMKDYCKHLNNQSIMLKTSDETNEGIIEYGTKLGGQRIHLYRNYKTWTDIEELIPQINNLNIKIPNKNVNLGGRSGGYWHSSTKDNRPTIIINGNKTLTADYPCSHINLCYRYETNNWYQQETYQELKDEGREQEDAYIISSVVHRDLTKYLVPMECLKAWALFSTRCQKNSI